jgi:hypothetical protein
MRIGIDFDNTIAGFDEVFIDSARRMGWVDDHFIGQKRTLRDAIRRMPDGEIKWQELQGRVYGAAMPMAQLIAGVDTFLKRCHETGQKVFIVSHKTEYGHYDPQRINLRQAALEWMMERGFFRTDGFGVALKDVYFEASRDEKLRRIDSLECSVFIDDLEEVLLDPGFPKGVRRILFGEAANGLPPDIVRCRTWREILQVIFGDVD